MKSISVLTTAKPQHPFYRRFCVGDALTISRDTIAHPTVCSAIDRERNKNVIVKRWRRSVVGSSDLEIIWRNEIRLLQALSAYPGGREYLAAFIDSAQDENHFLLALDVGGRLPLTMHSRANITRADSDRSLFWRNVRRLVKGTGILHAHGLVHRNIEQQTVFTGGGNSPDFQLSGFEWSIRLRHDLSSPALGFPGAPMGSFSFCSDWQSLGLLIAGLLGVPAYALDGQDPDNNSALRTKERIFIRDLLSQTTADAHAVLDQLNEVMGEQRTTARRHAKSRLYLIYDDATQSPLWKHLRRNSTSEEYDNESALESDLSHCTLIELKQPAPRRNQFALRGRSFTYYLKEYDEGLIFPRIDRIEREQPPGRLVVRHQTLSNGTFEIRRPFGTEQERRAIASRAQAWSDVFDQDVEALYPNPAARDVYDSFVVLHLLELLYHAAHVWPIVITHTRQVGANKYTYVVKLVVDANLGLLSKSLELEEPGRRLVELLERDEGVTQWQVLPLTGASSDFRDSWRFSGIKEDGTEHLLIHFSGSKWFNRGERLRLRAANNEGHERLMQRRAQLLENLKEHSELTEMLADPRSSVRPSHDPAPLESAGLDKSKQAALKEIRAVVPFYVLQGPPGTGKTHLVTELVRQLIALDPTARLLITSQGHEAVDHLMREIVEAVENWSTPHPPLIVRSRGSEDANLASQAKRQASTMLARLRASELSRVAPENLLQQLNQLQDRINNSVEPRIPDKALETLLLRSANIVFSSTNSADLKLLLDALSRFDWSFIEEAGRATGNELLAPLMLSHRRLLIGDSKQLPPFGEEKIVQLLKRPQQIQNALRHGQPLVKRQLGAIDVDYLFQRYADPKNVERLASNVERVLHLFDSLYRETFERKTTLPVAGRLDEQYRMHPALARVVSRVFYDCSLDTAADLLPLRKHHLKPFRFVRHVDALDSPMVMVCTPYAQVVQGHRYREGTPAYHNPIEVDAVIEVLASVRANQSPDKRPSLVVLTPYNEQARRLSRRIGLEMKGRLAHLKDFKLHDPLVRTIDSFRKRPAIPSSFALPV